MAGEQTPWMLHADGTAAPNPGALGVGVVVTGPDGAVFTASERLAPRGCNTAAEAWALATGLRLARQHGARRVVAHVDSRVVVDHVAALRAGMGRAPVVPRLVDAYAALESALAAFTDASDDVEGGAGGVVVVWIPRHHNLEADRLARAALDLPEKLPRWLRPRGRRNPHG